MEQPKTLYFGNGPSVLGPYLDTEIPAIQRAKQHLGWPQVPVYATRATSVPEAREQIMSAIRRGKV